MMKRSWYLFLASIVLTLVTFSQNVYFGNLHSHTSYSDGSGKPKDAYKYARNTAKLEFLVITEHNHKAAENGAAPDRKDGILIAKTPSQDFAKDFCLLCESVEGCEADLESVLKKELNLIN